MFAVIPETHLLPRLQQAFPNDQIVFLKSACNGQAIRRWDKEWAPPAGFTSSKKPPKTADCPPPADGHYGDLLDRLLVDVDKLAARHSRLQSVTFLWMQGETDATQYWDSVYEDSLRRVLATVAARFPTNQMTYVIGRLSDHKLDDKKYPGWNIIRNIQVKVAEEMYRRDRSAMWVNTDGFNDPGNGIHFDSTADGYLRFGTSLASKAIWLIQDLEGPPH